MELTGGRGVDMVFDVVGAAVWDQNLRSLKPGGRLVITGTTSETAPTWTCRYYRDAPSP